MPDAVVFLWNLDTLLLEESGCGEIARALLAEMNWRRGFYARLRRPLVLLLPEDAVQRLARAAPDFFDWNSGLYVFNEHE